MNDLIERLKAAGETSCLDRTSPFTTNNSATLHCEAAAEIERLRAALKWYGEQSRLCRLLHSGGYTGRHNLADDGGKRARAALQEDKTDD